MHTSGLRHSPNSGFSIVELLIALALGLLVVAGIVQLFVGNNRTYEVVNAQARLQENARFAFDFITRSARSAGYFGCAPETANVALNLVGNWNLIPEYNMPEPVDGWESNGNGTFSPDDLTTMPRSGAAEVNVHLTGNGIDRNELSDASDILVFRSIEKPAARLAQILQPDGIPIAYTPDGEPSFEVDDVVVLADCEQAAVFKVTDVATAGDETTLSRVVSGAAGPFENSATVTTSTGDVIASTLSILGRSYGASATIAPLETTFYFIARSTELARVAQAGTDGVAVNALWQKTGNNAPVELVQGIEDMQLLFGVDTTADEVLNVNQYLTIDNVEDVREIVVVQVTLIVSSVDALAETGNQKLQRTFTKTIHIRNMG